MRRSTEDREADRYERYAMCFQQSCMSNTKWRKTLNAIVDSEISIYCVEIKIIGDTYVSTTRKGFSHRDVGQIRFNDGSHGPLEYKWIEWIRFPRRVQIRDGIGHYKIQDIDQLKSVIDQTASIEMTIDDESLVVFGYRNRINSESMPDTGWE